MADGNKRYLGDVFINQENYEFQNNFIRDIIESYEYKNGGSFDAKTFQGMYPEDFATREQGEKAINALQSPLLIGKLSNEHYLRSVDDPNEAQYIYTDGVLLEREDEGLNIIDWYNNLENDDMTDALKAIYHNVVNIENNLQEDIDEKADNGEFQILKQQIDDASETFTENGIEVRKINSDLSNGLRFILITQEDYDLLPTADKQYWRNIFIIRDSIPADYEDPMSWDLSDGYEFRISDGDLIYKNNLSTEWKTVCSLEDLLEGADIFGLMKNFIEEDQEYIINSVSLMESLQNIPASSVTPQWQDYPFLSSSLHDDYIYDLKLNNNKNYITETIDNSSFKNVNIDLNQILRDNNILDQNGSNIIRSVSDNLSNQSVLLENTSNALNTAQTDIRDLKSSRDTLEADVNDLKENLTTEIDEYLRNIFGFKQISFFNNTSHILYNDTLRIANVQMEFNHWHNKNNSESWVTIGYLPEKFKPLQGFKSAHSPTVTLYFHYDRTIRLRADAKTSKTLSILAGGTFFY